MSVYFATCREANAVKIGHSLEPWSRLDDMQIGCPLLIAIEAILPGGFEEEQIYHSRFAEHRIHGEWFRITDIIELIIEQNPAPPPPVKSEMRRRIEAERLERSIAKRMQPKPRKLTDWERADRRIAQKKYDKAMAEMREAGL